MTNSTSSSSSGSSISAQIPVLLRNLDQILSLSSTGAAPNPSHSPPSQSSQSSQSSSPSLYSTLFDLINICGSASPSISIRLEALHGLTRIILKYELDLFMFSGELSSRLWYQIRDLFDKSKQEDAKLCALRLMCALFEMNNKNSSSSSCGGDSVDHQSDNDQRRSCVWAQHCNTYQYNVNSNNNNYNNNMVTTMMTMNTSGHDRSQITDSHHHGDTIVNANASSGGGNSTIISTGIVIDFFNVLKQVDNQIECSWRLRALRSISNHGRNTGRVTDINADLLVDTVMQSVQNVSTHTANDLSTCLSFLHQILRYNFATLSMLSVTKLIRFTTRIMMNPQVTKPYIVSILHLYETIVNFGAIPPSEMVTFCSTLCQSIQSATETEIETEAMIIMNALIDSPLRYRIFQVLVEIMTYSSIQSLYRGAIFFVSHMAWGSSSPSSSSDTPHNSSIIMASPRSPASPPSSAKSPKSPSSPSTSSASSSSSASPSSSSSSLTNDFRDSFATVLYSMLRIMSCNLNEIVYEIVSSVSCLVQKYGTELRVEWDPIIEILEKTQLSLENGPHPQLKATLTNTLNEIQNLQERGEFFGGNDEYYGLMRKYKDLCSTSVTLDLLSDLQKRIHPAYTNWLVDLRIMLEEYFEHDQRIEVNEKVLQIVRTLLWRYYGIAENRILDILLPFFHQTVHSNISLCIARKTLQLVIDMMSELTFAGKRYDHLSQILCKLALDGPYEELQLVAINGMAQAFKVKFCTLPCNEALSLYTCLLKILNHKTPIIRQKALECLLSMRSDRAYRLSFNGTVSPYLRCHSRNLIRTISFVLPVSNLIDALLDRVSMENDYHIFSLVITGIRDILLNFYLLKEPPVWRVCTAMCNIFKTRLDFILGDDSLADPVKFTHKSSDDDTGGESSLSNGSSSSSSNSSNMVGVVSKQRTGCAERFIHLLTIIVGYNTDDILSLTQKQSLVECFLFILMELYRRSHNTEHINTRLIVLLMESLTICVLEMPDVINVVFHRIVTILGHIRGMTASQDVPMKQELVIAILGLLHSLSSCVERKLRQTYILQIFDLLLDFTDNQRYLGEYIPLMTYRVLMSWFIACNFATRQKVIKTCLPVLYKRMSLNKSTLAETTIDFFVKFAYLSCDQTLQMNEQMKKIFNNGPYKAWSTGNSILTAQAGHFNYIMLRYRRPTGTIAWTMKLVNSIRNRSSDERDDSSSLNEDAMWENDSLKMFGHGRKSLGETVGAGPMDPYHSTTMSKSRSISSDTLSQVMPESDLSSLSSSAEIDSFLKSDHSRSLSPTFFDHDNFMRLAQSPLPLNFTDDAEHDIEQFELELNNSFVKQEEEEEEKDGAELEKENKAAEELVESIRAASSTTMTTTTSRDTLPETSSQEQQPATSATTRPAIAEEEGDPLTNNQTNVATVFAPNDQHGQHTSSSSAAAAATHDQESSFSNVRRMDDSDVVLTTDTTVSDRTRSVKHHQPPPDELNLPYTKHHQHHTYAPTTTESKKQPEKQSLITSFFNSASSDDIQEAFNYPRMYDQGWTGDSKKASLTHSRSFDHRSVLSKEPFWKTSARNNRASRANSDSSQILKPEEDSTAATLASASQKLMRPGTKIAKPVSNTTGLSKRKSLKNLKEGLSHLKLTRFNRHAAQTAQLMTTQESHGQQQQQQQQLHNAASPTKPKKVSPSTLNQRLFEKEGALHPNFPYLFLRNWPFLSQEEPHGLRYCDALTRALNMIDYIPSVETAKFALLYVSEGQTTEQQILKNTFGSHRYFKFLQQIGDFVALKDQRRARQSSADDDSDEDSDDTADSASYFSEGLLYTGGLDVGPELTDGNYALIYRDDICHVVFHAATMMPNLRHDEKFSNKKRHIGNDYVTIVYSDNSDDFNPNIITGQFNVVHIVIYPLEEGFNRVEVKTRDDSMIKLPPFGPLVRPQIVSDQALSSVVRLTALHADLAARAYRKSTGEFVSNWEERLRQINMIKQRYAKPKATTATTSGGDGGGEHSSSSYMSEKLNDWQLINAMDDFFD